MNAWVVFCQLVDKLQAGILGGVALRFSHSCRFVGNLSRVGIRVVSHSKAPKNTQSIRPRNLWANTHLESINDWVTLSEAPPNPKKMLKRKNKKQNFNTRRKDQLQTFGRRSDGPKNQPASRQAPAPIVSGVSSPWASPGGFCWARSFRC